MKKTIKIIALLLLMVSGVYQLSNAQTNKGNNKFPLAKTDAEWKKLLTPNQFYIMVEKGTEPPFKNAYFDNHQKGTYVSAATGEPLFSSDDKFESGTGWPSFTKPINPKLVLIITDADGMRQEVVERKTGLHLGHVFDDGPADRGGKRYCMNSGALKFIKRP
jgi:peptide-methionine (R)-S-oxide reductase/peptide methionine sulfoxide reductase msrA/msrB